MAEQNEADWKIEVMRPASVGGQQVGYPPMPIRVTHIPTGLVAQCGLERSQHKNKRIAVSMIEWGLVELRISLPPPSPEKP